MPVRSRTAPSPPGAHDPALDALRALALAAIVAFHCRPALMPGGWVGVDLFFALSGYLITGIVLREVAAAGRLDLRRFYWHRTLRIWPAFYALLAGVGLLTLVLGTAATAGWPAQASAATFTLNWFRAFGRAGDGALGHCWTLAVEQQFYLGWPLVLVALPPRRRLPATAGLAMAVAGWRCWLVAHGATMDRTYNGFDTHADALLVGAALAMVDRGPAVRRLRVLPALAFAAVASPALVADLHRPAVQAVGTTLAALAAAALIACARRPGWLRDALHWPPLLLAGRLSFGLYLWHYPMLFVGRPRLPPALGTAVPLLATIVLAALSWRYVERPALALKRRRSSRTAATP